METNIEIEKLGAYAKTPQRTADHLLDNLERQMLQDAEDMAGRQRSNCPEDTGLLRESIAAFCERDGDRVTAGSRTNMQYAAYVEFGTGPVGDEKGTPLDSELGIVRKHEPWTAYIPGYGFRRLKGRLPALFMYNGMQEMQPVIAEHYGTAIQEAIK